MSSRSRTLWLICAAIGIITLLAFLPTLGFEFVWDDDALIVFNSRVTELNSIPSYFATSFWNVSEEVQDISRPFYRPLIMSSYTLDHAIWGMSAAGYHLTNIILHTVNSLLLFFICRFFLRSSSFSFLASLLFALHPVHAENVCWISGRTDLLCATFMLSALFAYMHFIKGSISARTAIPVVTALYILSLLSKETGIIFPLTAAAISITHGRMAQKGNIITALCALLVTASLYMLIRGILLSNTFALDINLSIGERVAAAFLAVSRYFGLFLLSVHPDPHHIDAIPWSALDAGAMVAGLSVAAYGAAILLAYRRKRGTLAFWLAWPLITILPVMHIGSFGDVVYADRFLYIPSVGACILAAMALHRLSSVRYARLPAILASLILPVLYMSALLSYMPIWRSNIDLFTYASETSPKSAYIFYNLGNSFARDDLHSKACRAYAKAISLQRGYADATLNMSASLHKLNRHNDAIALLKSMLTGAKPHRRNEILASQYAADGDIHLADASQRKADILKRAFDREQRIIYALMADCYRSLSDIDSAVRLYNISIQHSPSYSAHNNLGECHLALGDPNTALIHFRKASQLKQTTEVFNNIGFILLRQELPIEAADALRRAESLIIQTTPPLTEIALLFNQAQLAIAADEPDKASALLAKALLAAQEHEVDAGIISQIDSLRRATEQ